jgi:class 3 adenylate cyclase
VILHPTRVWRTTSDTDDAVTRSSLQSEEAEIRTFLIADVRGYTVFTQEHGDEAAARLAPRPIRSG